MSGYKEFLDLIIDDGILVAKKKHWESDHLSKARLLGKKAGYDACRDKFPHQIVAVLWELRQDIATRYERWELSPDHTTGEHRQRDLCKAEAMEWVLQVLGAALGQRLGVDITRQAFEKASELSFLQANNKSAMIGETTPPNLEMR